MSKSEKCAFVTQFVRFLRNEIEQMTENPDSAESLEVAVQCLEAVYPSQDAEAAGSVDLWSLFRTSKDKSRDDAEALKNEGNRLMKEEKYEDALINYNRAISIDPQNPIFYCNRSAAWIRLGSFDHAISDARIALHYNPDYCKAHARLGDALTKVNRLKEALEAYQEAVRLEPSNADYRNKVEITRQRLLTTPQAAAAGGLGAGPESVMNRSFADMASRMMSDPSAVSSVLNQFSQSNGFESLVNAGLQLTAQLGQQNPELLANIQQVLQTVNPNDLASFVSTAGFQPGNQGQDPPPPPSGDGASSTDNKESK
ncbi:small glutamine-rich tetratricopeptide repeat-containing protein beta [Sergentomyia squamirostris]